MAAQYPEAVATFRELANKPTEEYDPAEKTTVFAEDFFKLRDEIVAIQNALGLEPGAPDASVKDAIARLRDSENKAGFIKHFAGPHSNIPYGWLLCNGDYLLRADWPDLFAAIGTRWGSSDDLNFQLPNLIYRYPQGAADEIDVGSYGGSIYHRHYYMGQVGYVSEDAYMHDNSAMRNILQKYGYPAPSSAVHSRDRQQTTTSQTNANIEEWELPTSEEYNEPPYALMPVLIKF